MTNIPFYFSLLRESERKRCESQMRCDPLISAFNPILPVASSFVLQDPPINRSLPSPLQLSSVPSRVLAPSQVRTLTPTPIRPSPSARRLAPSTPNRVSAVSKLATMAESPINTNTVSSFFFDLLRLATHRSQNNVPGRQSSSRSIIS